MSVKRLLDRCGVKGCLLGGIIATSIAKLVLSVRFFLSEEFFPIFFENFINVPRKQLFCNLS